MARRVGFGDDSSEPEGRGAPGRKRLIPAFFLTIWLLAWTAGIFYVSGALLSETGASDGLGSLMMVVWLVLAVIGWLFGVRTLRRVLRGETVRRGPHRPSGVRDPDDPDDTKR